MDDHKSKERLYAESCYEQNKKRLADELRMLLSDSPEFYESLIRIVNMDSRDAACKIRKMNSAHHRILLEYLIPAARVGFSDATFAMEDKSNGAATGGGAGATPTDS